MKPFDIRFTKLNDKRVYRAMVEITSEQSISLKVKVKAGAKEIEMEKYLFRKGNQWKMIKFNFKVEGSSRVNQKLIEAIQEAIDQKLK